MATSSDTPIDLTTDGGGAPRHDAGAVPEDLVGRRRRIDAVRGGASDAVVTGAVRGSWALCDGRVPTEATAPVVLDDPAGRWADSPLRRAAGGIIDELAALALREDYATAITDPQGRILWASAGPEMRRRAERASFVVGSDWAEGAAGTNAPGLTARTGHAATVFASEHWCDGVRDWVCYSAPIRDGAGRMAGVLDLSAHWRKASPLAMTTVTAMARLIEVGLASLAGPGLELRVLGPPVVRDAGDRLPLTMRHLEVLTVLAHRGGADRDELQALVWGDRRVSSSTVKAEISHLRSLLSGGIASRPYRLVGDVALDVTTVLEAAAVGDLETATRCYRGRLLPGTESPYLVDLGHHVDVVLRRRLLAAGTAEQLLRFAAVHDADVEVLERARAVAVPGSAAAGEAEARLAVAGPR